MKILLTLFLRAAALPAGAQQAAPRAGTLDEAYQLALSLRLTERSAADEIRRAHSALSRAIAVADSLERALVLVLENSELQAADYTNGLVTT